MGQGEGEGVLCAAQRPASKQPHLCYVVGHELREFGHRIRMHCCPGMNLGVGGA